MATAEVAKLIPDNANYALLYVYRSHAYTSSAARYKIFLNDTLACKVSSGSKHILKLYQEGNTELQIKGRGNPSVDINVAHGKVYFLRCDIALESKAKDCFKLVEYYPGWQEYNGYKGRDEK